MDGNLWEEQSWPEELYGRLKLSDDRLTIRLLHILSGKGNDQIRCKLFRSTLISSPAYEALSYTWGTSTDRRTLLVNNIELLITVNLEAAIRHIRRQQCKRLVWIDALCINQHDLAERSAQVQEMGNIYSFAERVLIWLGPPQGDTNDYNLATEFIRQEAYPDDPQHRCDVKKASRAVHAASQLLSHNWWTRVWVVQEMSRARRDPCIIVGPDQYLSWADLSVFHVECLQGLISIRDRTRTPPRLPDLDVEEAGVEAATKRISQDLSYLLDATHKFQSSDPRDKIFALWTLVRGSRGARLKPDYTNSISRVFTAVTAEIIEAIGTIDILGRRWGAPNKDFPSWVPDYSVRTPRPFPASAEILGLIKVGRNAAAAPQCVSVDGGPVKLHVTGTRIDHVIKVLAIAPFTKLEDQPRIDAASRSDREQKIEAEERELNRLRERHGMLLDDSLATRIAHVEKLRRTNQEETAKASRILADLTSSQAPFVPLIKEFGSWVASATPSTKSSEHGADELMIRQAWSAIEHFCDTEFHEQLMTHRSLLEEIQEEKRKCWADINWHGGEEAFLASTWTDISRYGGEEEFLASTANEKDVFRRRIRERVIHDAKQELPDAPSLVLFETSMGFTGFGSHHILSNDELVVLQDMQSVSVLRMHTPLGVGEATYFGSVFLHGRPSGTASHVHSKEGPTEVFKLV
ncbi:hypothetical protein LTS10_006069 [Elasticomyces elasticus]|nr:hypothetical protein LTS10_006069 [Elasticomyces elasticus]